MWVWGGFKAVFLLLVCWFDDGFVFVLIILFVKKYEFVNVSILVVFRLTISRE